MCADGVRHKRSRQWHIVIPATTPGKRASVVSMIDRLRQRRQTTRQNRAIDRAWQAAPTQAMRDEINLFAQRRQPL
ncbi:hypothetical protein GCM10023107_34010 [Actinoplanes octamycinicus]|nr:hypothetical protein Aoc01nite_46370 [Actinoplanes octamycinicus]